MQNIENKKKCHLHKCFAVIKKNGFRMPSLVFKIAFIAVKKERGFVYCLPV